MSFTYTVLLSGYVQKMMEDGTRTIIPPGTAAYVAFEEWAADGGVPEVEPLVSMDEVITRLHEENYSRAKGAFARLTEAYHPTEALEWATLENECRVFDASPLLGNIGPTMAGELQACEALGADHDPAKLAARVLFKAGQLRAARFAIVARRSKNREEISALPNLATAQQYKVLY